jgi:hypothetical protein
MNRLKQRRSVRRPRVKRDASVVNLAYRKPRQAVVVPRKDNTPASRVDLEFSETVLDWLEEEDYL